MRRISWQAFPFQKLEALKATSLTPLPRSAPCLVGFPLKRRALYAAGETCKALFNKER